MSTAPEERAPRSLRDKLTSRKFWLALALLVYALTGYATGQLSYEQAADLARVAVLAYIGAEAAVDAFAGRRFGGEAPR